MFILHLPPHKTEEGKLLFEKFVFCGNVRGYHEEYYHLTGLAK